MEEIDFKDFNDLSYGAYSLEYPHEYMSENVRYSTAEFNKLYLRKIRLPSGKGNVIYLLSATFNAALAMITNRNFMIPPGYRRVYYPPYTTGMFMGRRYRLSKMREKQEIDKEIKKVTNLNSFPGRVFPKTNDNVFYITSDIYEVLKPILATKTVKRNYTEFFTSFCNILKNTTPASQGREGEFDNRLLIIDVDSFKFDNKAPLAENKTNPLFLLYLAYFRNRDLSSFDIDMDMMICSKNTFIKFNPIQLKMEQWTLFRRALFRIMNANLDDYTESLTEEEKEEIADTAKDNIVAAAVEKAVEPYSKNISGSTKVALQNVVENKIRQQAAEKLKLDKEIKLATGVPEKEIDKKPVPTKEIIKKLGITPKNDKPQTKFIPKEKISLTTPKDTYAAAVHQNVAEKPLTTKQRQIIKSMLKYDSLAIETNEEYEDEDIEDVEYDGMQEDIEDNASDIIANNDEVAEEILDEIQDKNVPLNVPTAPVNSERDRKLREAQKKVVVGTETIGEILERDGANVPIESDNKSAVMHTSNKNMTQITFANFDKTYLDELYVKDIVACFDSLKDKESPFYITKIEVHDTSDVNNYKETWTVILKDETDKRHTMKVDIPKFQDNRFMLIQGNRYIIHKQNFYNPLVKDTPDTVIMTTNFNKVTITRVATKSLTEIERIFSFVKKHSDLKLFISGNSSDSNRKYLSTLEYDELSRRIYKFKSDNCEIFFSRKYIQDYCSESIPKEIKGNEFWIGTDHGQPILINEDTGLDRNNRTIADIIAANIPDKYNAEYNAIKGPTQSMRVDAKMAGQFVPAIVILLVWNGLKKTLDRMGIRWNFRTDLKRMPAQTSTTKYIRFANGILEFQASVFSELMLNGLAILRPSRFTFEDFETSECYEEFVRAKWGSYKGINEIMQFKRFLMDPITLQVCKDFSLPTDATGLLINAVKMLADNACVSKVSDTSYRVRSIETIPAILYSCIAAQYKSYVSSGRTLPMTLNQRCVISKLMQEKTVEAYSTLNPVGEVKATHAISTKGYKGSNSEFSYDEQKRSYDPSSVGKIAMTTPADANVGISHELTIEPTISNARGYRAPVENIEDLKDVNVFSPVEMLTPGTIRTDDPIRSAIAAKQSGHIVPTVAATPSLVSNGYDEAIQFHLSDDFVVNAEEDGEVIEINDKEGFIVVKYKSGKIKAINTRPEIVKNSGSGFYLSNKLEPTHTKVGEKFKKDEPLAYHPKYFYYSKLNGLRFSIGPLVKIAMMSTYNTYEDAGLITSSLADKMKTSIVYQECGKFKKNNNIISMVKIGDHVSIGDTLIKFDVSTSDTELAKYLSKLSDQNAKALENESKSDIKTSHAGKVIAIKVYSLLDPKSLSPSLGAVVQQYFDDATSRKEFLNKFDNTNSIMKAGYMLTDSSEPIKDRYDSIKGIKGIDVLIEIYIEHDDVMGVGDKLAVYGPNKQIVSSVIEDEWAPYSELHPDEQIGVFSAPGSSMRRMIPSLYKQMAASKCLIELKRKIAKEIKYK